MSGPKEISIKSSTIIKMTVSKNMLPLTSPTLPGSDDPEVSSLGLVTDWALFHVPLYHRTARVTGASGCGAPVPRRAGSTIRKTQVEGYETGSNLSTFRLRTHRAEITYRNLSSKIRCVGLCNEENDMRERMAYLIMIGMLLVVVLFVIAVVGKGEYQPPPPEQQAEQGSILHGGPL